MKITIAAALSALVIAAPAEARSQQPTFRTSKAADGFMFRNKEYTDDAPVIRIVEYPSAFALRAAHPGNKSGDVDAFSRIITMTDGRRVCEIHVVDPDVKWMPEILGHEVAHCLYGRWH